MDKVILPKVLKKLVKGFTAKEVQKMIDSYSYKLFLEVSNKSIIACMADIGLRSMEIRGLKNKDIKDTTIIVHGKGQKERVVFQSPALKKILIKYNRLKKEYFRYRNSPSDHYFLSYQGEGLSHAAILNLVKEAGRRAGIENALPHKFRHFYAVSAISGDNSMDTYSMMLLLGHSDISTIQQYTRSLNTEELRLKANSASPLMNLR